MTSDFRPRRRVKVAYSCFCFFFIFNAIRLILGRNPSFDSHRSSLEKLTNPNQRNYSLTYPPGKAETFLSISDKDQSIMWKWRNRFLYTCWLPERVYTQPFLVRKPRMQDGQKLVYVTAKFGPTADTWYEDVQRHRKQIARRKVFDEIAAYTDFPSWILNDTSYEKHLVFRLRPAHRTRIGAGYWFWKPVLIHHHLEQLNDGDFLVYSDADRPFAPWTALLVEAMISQDANLAAEQMRFRERKFDKRDVYVHFCGADKDQANDDTGMYNANWIAIRKTASTLNFTSQWAKAASDFHLISNEKSRRPEIVDFRTARHDQSMFSLLLKCVHEEPYKSLFPYTCLDTWTAYTFKLE